jgi:hypothetical protein
LSLLELIKCNVQESDPESEPVKSMELVVWNKFEAFGFRLARNLGSTRSGLEAARI